MEGNFVPGHKIGKEICNKLGIDSDGVYSLDLHIDCESTPTLTIRMYAKDKVCQTFSDEFKYHGIKPTIIVDKP